MLSLILDWQKKEYDFKGNKITCEIRPLKRRAMLELLPYQGKHPGKRTKEQVEAMSKEERADYNYKAEVATLELQGLAEKVFPDHVRNVEGISINGAIPSPEQFAQELYLCELTTGIIIDLMHVSALKAEDEKNSGGASGNLTLEVNNLESSADAPSI